jgi:isopenicillin-N epimerase
LEFARLWSLDPAVAFLNHGSFGACPRAVLETQQHLRDRMEENPVRFLKRDLEGLLTDARERLATFLGADSRSLVFVRNTTSGINAVLRSVELKPGDELLITDHAYRAIQNAAEFVAARRGARLVSVRIPYPLNSPEQVVEAVLRQVTDKTRLAILDHVTCLSGLLFPIERLVHELDRRGVDTVVDGAHAPGMVPLHLADLGASYYVGNCHKWLCAPKGSAFLHVRADRQSVLHPLVISHGPGDHPKTSRSPFQLSFDWTGTDDPTPWLTIPHALQYLAKLLPGGWPAIMARNQALALEARELVCRALNVEPPCPDEMVGSLASVLLPDAGAVKLGEPFTHDPLQAALFDRYRIEVVVVVWPTPRRRLLRLSAHLYNIRAQYLRLAEALRECLVA